MNFNLNDPELLLDLLSVCVKHGIVPETKIRNYKLKKRYAELMQTGIKAHKARDILSEEFFICERSVQAVLYGNYKKKDKKPV